MADLLELRERIDRIDKEIIRLYEERMQVCREIGEYKIANELKVFDSDREAAKLAQLAAMVESDIDKENVTELFELLMDKSKDLQYRLLDERHACEEEI